MKLVVGLGNPGKQYEKTKHNIGFMVVDAIADSVPHTPWREEQRAEVCSITVAGEKVLLVKPQTFMNASGESIGPLISHIGTENFPRFRVGIGRPLPQWTVIDHVLAPFSEESQEKVQKGIKDTVKAVLGTLEVGIDKGMNLFNPKRRPQR